MQKYMVYQIPVVEKRIAIQVAGQTLRYAYSLRFLGDLQDVKKFLFDCC